jgi:hypothetical protein
LRKTPPQNESDGTDREITGSRVFVELGDGFNCVGEVRRVSRDSRGRRTVLIEDNHGQERAVRPGLPSVSVEILNDDGDDDLDGDGRGGSA